jgi:iron only hydrogenase large subunit-like protein
MELTKGLDKVREALDKKEKLVVLLAPSFIAEWDYPEIIWKLRACGFDKISELTFGAKVINKEYHKIIKGKKKQLWIASVCPGIVETIKAKYPKYQKNLIPVDSPMIATAKICKKYYPEHKTIFISPCTFKKIESQQHKEVDFAIDYQELNHLFKERLKNKKIKKTREGFDKFYNDYTKIYPLAGGLSKTAHLKNILKPEETKIIGGILDVEEFLKNPDPKIRFLDVNFCVGSCIGGPAIKEKNLTLKKEKVMAYLHKAEKEKITKGDKGVMEKAKGIDFYWKF